MKRLALVAIHRPHGGCPDNEAEHIYVLLSAVVKQSRKDVMILTICGDWSAIVGGWCEADDTDIMVDNCAGGKPVGIEWCTGVQSRIYGHSTLFLSKI